jgi:uncharacterized repeat protein (TIGR01451 family)
MRIKWWRILLAPALGLGLFLLLTAGLSVLAREFHITQTTLEEFNLGTLYRTGLSRIDDGEIRLQVQGIAGEWITDTNTTGLLGVAGHCAIVHGDYMYVIGGHSTSSIYDARVYQTTIDPETHDLADWTELTATPLPSGRKQHGCAVLNDRIYVVGGLVHSGNSSNEVFHAYINEDGTLSPWQTTLSLPAAVNGGELVALDGRLYVLGGMVGAAGSQVWYAQVDPASGDVDGQWNTASASLLQPQGYFAHRAVAGEGRIYVVGGCNGTIPTVMYPYVDYTVPEPDGDITGWIRTTENPNNLFAHEALLINGQLYALAGAINLASQPSPYVSSAFLDPDGMIPDGGWVDTEIVDPERIWHAAVSSIDGWIYLIGGFRSDGIIPPGDGMINRGPTMGDSGFIFAPWGTFTSDVIEIDANYNRTLTRFSWNTTIMTPTEMAVDLEYRYRAAGEPWSEWQGPFASDPTPGTVTTTVPIEGAAGRWFQYRATLSTDIQATPLLNAARIYYDVPEPPEMRLLADPPSDSLVEPGDIIRYQLFYTNTSDYTTFSGVVITDYLPISSTVIITSVYGLTPTVGLDTIRWEPSVLEPHAVGEAGFWVLVDPNAPEGTVLHNYAMISTDQAGLGFSNHTYHLVGSLLYDLSVTCDDGVHTAAPGDLLDYLVTYSHHNDFGANVSGVVLTGTLEPADYLTHPGGDGWTLVSPGVYRYEIGTLAPAVTGTVSFPVQVSASLPISDLLGITTTIEIAAPRGAGIEINPANNVAVDVNIVNGPDLVVTGLALSPPYPVISETLTLYVTVENWGLSDTDGWFFVELYDKHAAFDPPGPPDGPLDHVGGYCGSPFCTPRPEYLFSVAGLAPGETIVIPFQISTTIPGLYSFYAQADITFDAPDPWGKPWGLIREGIEFNNILALEGIHVYAEPLPTGPIRLPVVFRNWRP